MTPIAIAFVLTLTLWAGVMIYSWATTYPMFRGIGEAEFVPVHKIYERGLPIGVYLPFGAMGLAVATAVAVAPRDIPEHALWLAGAGLAGGIATTALCAAPMHIRLIRDGKDSRRIELMLKCNAWRAVAAGAGLAAAIATLLARA